MWWVWNTDVNVALKRDVKTMISTWNIYHLDLLNHRFSTVGRLQTHARAYAAFCRLHHYIYSDHLLFTKRQGSEAVFVCMHDALLLVCVCVLCKCAGVAVNNPLVVRTAEFNCSEDLFQFDVPWWITDIEYKYKLWYYKKNIYFHTDLIIILNTAIWSSCNPTNILLQAGT